MSAVSFAKFQKLGRALMLPIAVLPVAGLLLRLGQPDLLNIKWIADAGGAVFTNLPLIFSIGDTSRLRLLPHLLLPFHLRDSKVQSGNARPR